jgi:hypothetical protein
VRVQKADNHEKGLPFLVELYRVSPQPGNGLCREEAVEMITLIGCASEIPVQIEEVETVRLQGCTLTDGAVHLE